MLEASRTGDYTGEGVIKSPLAQNPTPGANRKHKRLCACVCDLLCARVCVLSI